LVAVLVKKRGNQVLVGSCCASKVVLEHNFLRGGSIIERNRRESIFGRDFPVEISGKGTLIRSVSGPGGHHGQQGERETLKHFVESPETLFVLM